MIEHIWTVACSRAVIDERTKSLTLQDVIEQVIIMDTPKPDGVLDISMNVTTLWARSDPAVPCQGRTRFAYCNPAGTPYVTAEMGINLSKSLHHRTIWNIHRLPVREGGRYTFRVESQNEGETEWHQVAAIPLEIIFSPQPIEQPQGQSQ